MDYISAPKNADLLDFFRKVIKENADAKIYLTGNMARKFLVYARDRHAERDVTGVSERAVLRRYEFENEMGEKISMKIMDDLDDRAKYQVVSFSWHGGTQFDYRVSKSSEQNFVLAKEVLISDRPYEKEHS